MTHATSSDNYILIVDDISENIRILARFLTKEGYKVKAALNAEDAGERIKESIPDLILLDIMMPGKSGIEFCKEIKENPATSHIPVIMVSALTDSDVKVKAFNIGAQDYITKPFMAQEVLARVKYQITLRRNQEKLSNFVIQLKELNQLKNNFLNILSHDMRNPLSGILGVSSLLEESDDLEPEEIRQLAGIVRQSGKNLYEIIDQLLGLTHLNKSELLNEPVETNLKDLIIDVIDLQASSALVKQISVEYSLPESLPQIFIDANKLKHILGNLLSNAIKFSHKDSRIKITASSLSEAGKVTFSVQDFGLGMHPDMVHAINNHETPVRRKGTANEPSTGIGLHYIFQFLNVMDGTMSVSSTPNEGSTFKLMFPVSFISNQAD